MRVSTFSSLLAATLLATTGVLAQYDDEYSGALTARDLFEDDLLQERSFDDFEDYEARDFDDEFEARDYFEDDFEARDYYDDEFEARDFGDEDEWLVARTKYATLGGSGRTGGGRTGGGRTGGGRTGGPGSIPNRDRQSLIGATGPSRSPGRGLTGVPPRGKIGLSPPFRPTGVKLPGIGRGGSGRIPPNIKYASGMTGLRPPTGKRGAGRTKQSKAAAAVEARDIYEALLEERGKMGPGGGPRGGPGGAGRRRRKNQRKRLRNKLRKQKAAAAAAAQEPAAGGAPDPSAGGAAPEAPQQRDFEVDELD